MRKETIKTYIKHLNGVIESGLSRNAYAIAHELNSGYFWLKFKDVLTAFNNKVIDTTDFNEIVRLMSTIDSSYVKYKNLADLSETTSDEISEDTDKVCNKKETEEKHFDSSEQLSLFDVSDDFEADDDRNKIEFIRDPETGKIQFYSFKVARKDKAPLTGKLTRDEMNNVYRMYSYYGMSITQREISRYFPEYSLIDFKRILRVFSITKAVAPFAPHIIEEHTKQELIDMQMREKETDFLRTIEEEEVRNTRKLLKKYAQENIQLKQNIENLENIDFKFLGEDIKPVILPVSVESSNQDLLLHLSDLHIGAMVETTTLYKNEWNFNEAKRRLDVILEKVADLGHFNTIILNLLGDNLDGMDNQTARRDHFMPQNMDNVEQVNSFIKLLEYFISSLVESGICNNLKIYSVKEGNHDGTVSYVTTMALLYKMKLKYANIETTLFDEFFGFYKFKDHTYILTHGKDGKYMKRGLPLNLDEKSKVMIYEWLDEHNITGDNIHVIKGDLHSENLNSCKKLDYRNVLSLFGASDYSNMNFSRNSYGVSYDLFIGDNLVRGSFENI